jgi:transposase InsO family protein
MQQREQFLVAWISHQIARTVLCLLFGISRQTGYKWVKRYKEDRSLEERSRRPKTSPTATPLKFVKLILSQRRQFPLWGAVPIRKRLTMHWPQHQWPAASTIGAILKRHGMVRARRRRYRAVSRTRPFSACREPNDIWCVDFKGQFATSDGRTCYPLTVMDAASRYLLACVGFHEPTAANVQGVFVELFRKFGLPKAIRSDNGEPFASVSRAAGLTRLSAWWARLGIKLERIDPGKPQQNGRHERMHLTLKQATCSPPRSTLGWQQRAFDRFRREYNEVRPHQSLKLETPASLYRSSARRYPEILPELHYPFCDVHLVRPDGTILFNKRKQLVTTSLAGEFIGLQSLDDRYVQVFYANVMLGFIDAQRAEYGLVRPKIHRRKQQATKLEVQRTAHKTSRRKLDRPAHRPAQWTKQVKRSTRPATKRDTTSAMKARRR